MLLLRVVHIFTNVFKKKKKRKKAWHFGKVALIHNCCTANCMGTYAQTKVIWAYGWCSCKIHLNQPSLAALTYPVKPCNMVILLYMYLIQSLKECVFVLCAPRLPLPPDLLPFLLLSSWGAQVPCCWLGIPSRIAGRYSWCATRCSPSIICPCKKPQNNTVNIKPTEGFMDKWGIQPT